MLALQNGTCSLGPSKAREFHPAGLPSSLSLTSGCMATPVAHTQVPNGSTLSASSPLRFTVRAPGPTRFTLHEGAVQGRMVRTRLLSKAGTVHGWLPPDSVHSSTPHANFQALTHPCSVIHMQPTKPQVAAGP